MDERTRAEEQLRVIQSLVDRAPRYRAISARVALIGGLASLGISGWMLSLTGFIGSAETALPMTSRDFIVPWLLPFLLSTSFGLLFLWRAARQERRPFYSAGFALALGAFMPAALVAAAITYVAWRNPSDLDGPVVLGLTWLICAGLALLAMASFAPRALVVLGWSFVITATVWLLLLSAPTLPEIPVLHGIDGANIFLGLTFGIYLLLYAVGVSASAPRTEALNSRP